MRFVEKTVTITYKEFEVGELVKPSSPRCVLPQGVYRVTKFLAPMVPHETDGIVFVEGRSTGISAEYLMPVEDEDEE